MAEITSPRIKSISDPGPGPQDQPSKKTRLKTTTPGKPSPPDVPEISQPEEEEKHKLDEMA